jgi:hypothetical protein
MEAKRVACLKNNLHNYNRLNNSNNNNNNNYNNNNIPVSIFTTK